MKREIKTKAFGKDGLPITAVIGQGLTQAQASESESKEKKTPKGDD